MKKILSWWQRLGETSRLRFQVLIALLLLAILPSLWVLARNGDWDSFILNFSTEMGGAFVTFILIDQILGKREKRDEEERERQLNRVDRVKRMSSEINAIARRAVEEFRDSRELFTGALHGISITGADLSNANLQGANLEGIHGVKSKLISANLQGVNFKVAFLIEAYLQNADLGDANLQGAFLSGSDLQGAKLTGANLEKVILGYTIIGIAEDGTELRHETKFDEHTIMADGNPWTPETDLTRFTNPTHPQFWRSNKPNSPAFRGKVT